MEPMPKISLTVSGFHAKMDIGGNHLGSCLDWCLLLFVYDDSNFFVLRFAYKFKVELYFHT